MTNNNNNNNTPTAGAGGWIEGRAAFDRIFHYIETVLDNAKIRCLCAQYIFDSSDLTHTKIDNEQYWIYAHCKNCEYDYNYEKILRQYNEIIDDQHNLLNAEVNYFKEEKNVSDMIGNELIDKWNPEELK